MPVCFKCDELWVENEKSRIHIKGVDPSNKAKHIEIKYILSKINHVFYVLAVEKDFNKNVILHNKAAS